MQALKILQEARGRGLGARRAALFVSFVEFLIQIARVPDESPQDGQMTGTTFDFLINNHPVKAFAGRVGKQLLGQRDVFLACKTESEQNAARHGSAFFDSFANFHFLFAGQQRDFAHLAQIHLDGIVQDIQAAFLYYFFFRFGRLGAIKVGRFHDLDFTAAQLGINGIEEFG